MSIPVVLRGQTTPTEMPFSDFSKILQVEYLCSMRFSHPKIEAKIKKCCARAHAKGLFTEKQLWMGCYYAQEIKEGRGADVTIAWIDEPIGYGIFANRDIPAFTYIGEYLGCLRKPTFFRDRTNYYNFNYYITLNYCERNLRAPYLIDARDAGNFTRYLNHSDRPNLSMASAYCAERLHIIFYANCLIRKGKQLLYDYGPIYWEKRSPPLSL